MVEDGGSLASPLGEFVLDLLISTALGAVFGVALAVVISTRRLGIWRESPTIAVLLVVVGSYFTIDYAGGSGYLGAFLAGLIVVNMDELGLGMRSHRETEMRVFTRGGCGHRGHLRLPDARREPPVRRAWQTTPCRR